LKKHRNYKLKLRCFPDSYAFSAFFVPSSGGLICGRKPAPTLNFLTLYRRKPAIAMGSDKIAKSQKTLVFRENSSENRREQIHTAMHRQLITDTIFKHDDNSKDHN